MSNNKTSSRAADASLQLDHQLCFSLYSTSLAMTKVYKTLLAPLKLTYPQYLVLLVLWEREGLLVSELGERLFLDSGTLTPLLKRMETAGWLRRERSTEDERRVHIHLTSQGRRLKSQATAIPSSLLQSIHCSRTELTSLTQQMQALRERLNQAASADSRDS